MKKYILIIILILISGCEQGLKECELDSDCVPASCCHPTDCVSKENKPDCEGIFCTMECKDGTLDCGQGSCKCLDNKCGVAFK